MSNEMPIDKEAIADNTRRTVERVALRKVRNLVDEHEQEELASKRIARRSAIVLGILVVVLIVVSVLQPRYSWREQDIKVPGNSTVPKKPTIQT